MRSKKTTNILLFLAFLFILTVIILCLLPTYRGPADDPTYKGVGQDKPEKTTSRTTTTTVFEGLPVTLSETNTLSTAEEDGESTSFTAESTTEKHFPPTTLKIETSHSSHSSHLSSRRTSTTTTTIYDLTTLPKYIDSTTTEHSTHKETVPYSESYTLFESSTETHEDSSGNATRNYTSIHSTTPNTTLAISTTTSTTVTTTTPETSTPTTTTTTPIPTTTPTTTTTTPIPTTTPYDHIFTLYKEPEGVCASDGCKDISGKMLDSIDHETDPCENFHKYSCGGVEKDEFLKPESAEENLDRILKEQLVSHETNALKFYDSCLNFLDGTENLKHEEIFPPDWKVDFPKSEIPNWPSDHLTITISNLLKRDLPILFDVESDVRKIDGSIKILPKLRISLFDEYEDHYDHKYCIDQFHREMMRLNNKKDEEVPLVMMANYEKGNKPEDGKGKPENQTEAKIDNLQKNSTEEEEEIIDIDINALYHQYHECMNTTGLDLRMNSLESVLMESDLFAKGLKPLEKQSQIEKIRAFLIDLNGIYFTSTNPEGDETPTIVTLSDLIGNTVLGGLVKWDLLLESLHGFKFEKSQEIVVESLQKFSRIFSYSKDQWNDKNLENVLLMLAGEKLFKKGENRKYKKNFCFKITKKYLPLDMQFLFTKSFSEEDLNVLVSEIYNLGSTVPIEIAKISAVYYYLPTHVEFINQKTMKSNMELQKSELVLSGEFLEDLNLLQTRYRKNMYNMSGTELEVSESCRLLPREVQIPCNLHADRILVPLEQLVPPNYIFRKDMPNYLRLAGVTYYMTKMMALQLGTDVVNLKSYRGNDCLIQNIPTFFEERNSKLRIKYKAHVTEEMKSEILMEFQAFNVAWRVINYLVSTKSSLKLNETEELPLVWLGSKPLHPLKSFLIRKAQETCNANKEFDLMRISRFKSPPNSFWVNSLIKIDTLYGSAWHCALNSSMTQTRECPPESTTTDWFNPYARPTPLPLATPTHLL